MTATRRCNPNDFPVPGPATTRMTFESLTANLYAADSESNPISYILLLKELKK